MASGARSRGTQGGREGIRNRGFLGSTGSANRDDTANTMNGATLGYGTRIGGFITGLEELPFIEQLSERFEASPRVLVKAALGIVACLVVICVVVLLSQTGGTTSEVVEKPEKTEPSSALTQAPTDFDQQTATSTGAPAQNTVATDVTTVQSVVIYITGAVNSPGVYTFKSTDRISDAVELAGGFTPEAASAAVNLAQLLSDGMQIHIPTLEEVASNAPGNGAVVSSGASGTTNANGTTTGSSAQTSLVNINTADSATLQTLDGVGPATAQKIIDYRTAHGKFTSKEELLNVSGIGEKKYAALEAKITA